MPGGFFYRNSLDRSISNIKGVWFLLPCFTAIPILTANIADPDQTPRSVASDLGVQCSPMSLLWDARHFCNREQTVPGNKNCLWGGRAFSKDFTINLSSQCRAFSRALKT